MDEIRDAPFMKEVTGGDTISVRFLYKEIFDTAHFQTHCDHIGDAAGRRTTGMPQATSAPASRQLSAFTGIHQDHQKSTVEALDRRE